MNKLDCNIERVEHIFKIKLATGQVWADESGRKRLIVHINPVGKLRYLGFNGNDEILSVYDISEYIFKMVHAKELLYTLDIKDILFKYLK